MPVFLADEIRLFDAAYYPHLIDFILDFYVESDLNASHLRLVCKDWRRQIDELLARFAEVQVFTGPRMPGKSARQLWMVRSCRSPQVTLSLTPLHLKRTDGNVEGQETDGPENPFLFMPSFIGSSIRILNLVALVDLQPTERIFGSLPNLHTVILHAPNLDYACAFAHIDRIIFSQAPRPGRRLDENYDSHPCRLVTGVSDARTPQQLQQGNRPLCSRKHTRKLVINQTASCFQYAFVQVYTPPVQEIVIILCPWTTSVTRVLAGFSDPRQCVVPFVLRGLQIGAKVTIVNPEQLAFESGAPTSTNRPKKFTKSSASLKSMIERFASLKPPRFLAPLSDPECERAVLDIQRLLRIIDTPTYVQEIGWREFEIEACLRCPTVELV